MADERRRHKTAVEEIYKRPEQQHLTRELAKDLEDQNRVRRLFEWLAWASQVSFGLLWASIIMVLVGVASVWVSPPFFLLVAWGVLLALLLLGFIICVTLMWFLDARFFRLVHRIIEPEGE